MLNKYSIDAGHASLRESRPGVRVSLRPRAARRLSARINEKARRCVGNRLGAAHGSVRSLAGWAQDAGGATPPDPSGPASAPPPPPPVPPTPTAPTSSSATAPAVPSPPAVPDVPSQPDSGNTEGQGDLKPPHSGGGNRDPYVNSTDGLTTTMRVPAKSADPGKPASPASRARFGLLARPEPVYGRQAGPKRRPGLGGAKRRANAKLSPLGAAPGFGNQLPSRSPSVSLLRNTGGAAGLALAGMLAVLGGAVMLRRDHYRVFRMPTVTWRPLATSLRSSCPANRHQLVRVAPGP